MNYPDLLVISGTDVIDVVDNLKHFNINYNIRFDKPSKTEKTKLLFKFFDWPDNSKIGFQLINIQKGLNLPFFKSEPVELEWNVDNCIPKEWFLYSWDINLGNDLENWFSDDFEIKITNQEKILLTNIVNNIIHHENEILRIYTESVMLTFLHPHIQNLLRFCTYCKTAHINIWSFIKVNLGLEDNDPMYITPRSPSTTLEDAVFSLTEIIAREEIKEPSATKLLTYFTAKGQLIEFFKHIQRRDKESQQTGQVLQILLDELEKMYPFLKKCIKSAYYHSRKSADFTNKFTEAVQFRNILKK